MLGSNHDNSKSIDIPTTKDADIICPGVNNTIYQADGTKKYFQVICGIDYNGKDGAVDLASENADTMADCINECASREVCTSAGWGSYNGNQVCFMKSSIGTPNTSQNWMFTKEVSKPDKNGNEDD